MAQKTNHICFTEMKNCKKQIHVRKALFQINQEILRNHKILQLSMEPKESYASMKSLDKLKFNIKTKTYLEIS